MSMLRTAACPSSPPRLCTCSTTDAFTAARSHSCRGGPTHVDTLPLMPCSQKHVQPSHCALPSAEDLQPLLQPPCQLCCQHLPLRLTDGALPCTRLEHLRGTCVWPTDTHAHHHQFAVPASSPRTSLTSAVMRAAGLFLGSRRSTRPFAPVRRVTESSEGPCTQGSPSTWRVQGQFAIHLQRVVRGLGLACSPPIERTTAAWFSDPLRVAPSHPPHTRPAAAPSVHSPHTCIVSPPYPPPSLSTLPVLPPAGHPHLHRQVLMCDDGD